MTWLQGYQVRHYIAHSIWVAPSLSMLAALIVVRLICRIDETMGLESHIDPEVMRTLLGTLAASMFTFVVFVCSALLIAVQLASAQLTPRIIAFVFRDPATKLSLSLFVFIFTYSLSVLIRIKSTVPLLSSHVAAYGFMLSLVVFLYLVDHVGKTLRPSGALRVVAREGQNVIENVYPQRLADLHTGATLVSARVPDGEPAATIPSPKAGVVLAFDLEGMLALARQNDCVIEMIPQVGDHVAAGDPLFHIFPASATLPAGMLCQSVAVGQERTLEQDPTFPFRIMVDIASKALSPAINDPTTAVLALDEIHHLLRVVGHRYLATGEVRDAAGRLRLVYRTPDWEDFVRLAVTEIRHFGGESIQVARRLRAMLEDLVQTLPDSRAMLLRRELTLLQRSAERFFAEPEDRALAEVGDLQGVGGKHDENQG